MLRAYDALSRRHVASALGADGDLDDTRRCCPFKDAVFVRNTIAQGLLRSGSQVRAGVIQKAEGQILSWTRTSVMSGQRRTRACRPIRSYHGHSPTVPYCLNCCACVQATPRSYLGRTVLAKRLHVARAVLPTRTAVRLTLSGSLRQLPNLLGSHLTGVPSCLRRALVRDEPDVIRK